MPFVAYQEELPVLIKNTKEELENIKYMEFTSIKEVEYAEMINGVIYFDKEEVDTIKTKMLRDKYSNIVQQALNNFANTRLYDDIFTACSYANSTNEKFKQEAEYCIKLRDDTWAMCYQILDDVVDGKRDIPSEEELLAELPVGSAKWPNE